MTYLLRATLAAKIAAKFPQTSMANPTNSELQAVLLDLLDSATSPELSAVTAVATTGVQLPDDADYVVVTSASADNIVVLPPRANVSAGKVIKLESGANGFELSTGTTGDTINNVAASVGVKEAAIPATGLAVVTAVTAPANSAIGWQLQYYTELGALATAIVPD